MGKQWETKKRILRSLSAKTKTLTTLAEELNLSQATVSQHLHELLNMGAIKELDDQQRKWKYYEMDPSFDPSIYQETMLQRNRVPFALGGAAILIIAAVIYYTALAPHQPTCAGLPGFTCTNVVVGSSGTLSATIGGFAQEVHINGVGCSLNSSVPTRYTPSNVSVAAGAFASINITCPQLLLRPAAMNALHVWVSYSTASGAAQTEQVAVINFASSGVSTTTVQPTTTAAPIQACGRLVTLYVGQSDACGQFIVSLADLTYPNASGVSAAVLDIYYNGAFYNSTQVFPGQTITVSQGGNTMQIYVNATFAGLYAYQRWAKIELIASGTSTTVSTTTTTTPTVASTTVSPTITVPPPQQCNALVVIYVGQNDICSPFTAELTDLAYPNANGISAGVFSIYYNGALINSTQLSPGQTGTFRYNGNSAYLYVNATFAGLYSYQRWAKVRLGVAVGPTSTVSTTISTTSTPTSSISSTTTIAPTCTASVPIYVLLYVGQNISCSGISVTLADLTYPSNSGVSDAVIDIYDNGVLLNSSNVAPNVTAWFLPDKTQVTIHVNQTFAGLYAYQKWAKLWVQVNPPIQTCNGFVTVYVFGYIYCGRFMAQLANFGTPNANGIYGALVDVYSFNGVLTNSSMIYPPANQVFAYGGNTILVTVNQTVYNIMPNYYPFQRWARLSMNVT